MTDLSTSFDDALVWASELHRDDVRKGSAVPYVSHVLAVASLVIEDGGDEDTAIAALLHDAIEDCDVTAADIAVRFGDAVAAIVDACTDATEHPKPPWRGRKERAIARLADPRTDVRAVHVAAADKLHNVTSLLNDLVDKRPPEWWPFSAPPEQTVWYYESMHTVIEQRLTGSTLPRRLGAAIAELRQVLAQ